MVAYSILENISKINKSFSELSTEEMSLIDQVVKKESISEKEWFDVLDKSRSSYNLLSFLCEINIPFTNVLKQLALIVPDKLLLSFLSKDNIDPSTADYICDKIEKKILKEYIESNSNIISDIFKKSIMKFDYKKSESIEFANYQYFNNIKSEAEKMVSLYPMDENLMTAISNNKNLPDKIRNDAFNNMHNPLNIENYTDYMKMTTYRNAVIRIFDYPQKKLEDIEDIENAKDVLISIIEKHELPLSCEYDLLQRLQDMPALSSSNLLMNALLKHTHDAIILKKAYDFNPRQTKQIIENNPYCDIFTIESFIKKSVEKMNEYSKSKDTIIPLLKEKNFIYKKILNQPLSLESYKKIHRCTKSKDSLLDFAILVSPYINVNSVKDLFENDKHQMVRFREKLEQTFAKNGLPRERCFDFLNYAVYCLFKNDEEYFKQPQSLSLDQFFTKFGKPITNILPKERELLKIVCDEILFNKKVEWVKEFDKQIKKIYNIENEFGPYGFLYNYHNGKLQFDVDKFCTLPSCEKKQFISNVLNSNNINSIEFIQQSIENEIAEKGLSAKTCILISDLNEIYDKISAKITEIEEVLDDRENNMGI